jgi:hypothetical protein
VDDRGVARPPAPPARACQESTCWRVARSTQEHVSWHELEAKAREVFAREQDSYQEMWLIAPDGRAVAYTGRACARCEGLGYAPNECAERVTFSLDGRDYLL